MHRGLTRPMISRDGLALLLATFSLGIVIFMSVMWFLNRKDRR